MTPKLSLRPVLAALICAAVFFSARSARADVFTFYLDAKGVFATGSGDVFKRFKGPVPLAGGAEVGFELFYVDFFAEALIVDSDTFLFTTNLGFDFAFGDDVRLEFGLFTGPMFFMFPEDKTSGSESLSDVIGENEQRAIEAAAAANGQNVSFSEIEGDYNRFLQAEKDIERLAVGWNLARLRVALDFKLAPFLYLGVVGMAGYHLLISGEAAAAGAKNEAVNQLQKEYGLGDFESNLIRDAAGAEAVDTGSLRGVNFNIGLSFKLEI